MRFYNHEGYEVEIVEPEFFLDAAELNAYYEAIKEMIEDYV